MNTCYYCHNCITIYPHCYFYCNIYYQYCCQECLINSILNSLYKKKIIIDPMDLSQ